jgi:predicted HicB family RNase H-like nuclease
MKRSDRYLKIVEWSEEDRCYIGTCPGLMLGGIHGRDEARVYAELCRAVEEWIAIHETDGIPLPAPTAGKDYSGKFVVRVGKDLHRQLAVNALYEGVSLNSYCARVLREEPAAYGRNEPADRSSGRKANRPSPGRHKEGSYRLNAENRRK